MLLNITPMERLLVIFCLFTLDKPTKTLMNRVAELLPAHLTVSFFPCLNVVKRFIIKTI